MNKEDLCYEFTREEFEILKIIMLERSTFYTKKIVEDKKLVLKTQDLDIVKNIEFNIDYNLKLKNVFDKFYNILNIEMGENKNEMSRKFRVQVICS
ncbi:MAG: hypothetical protein HFJ60_04605 [Clostridia bacterium]|jgi:hypothetical protein|nr:hypothetical protein [Clostridia bacterium]